MTNKIVHIVRIVPISGRKIVKID